MSGRRSGAELQVQMNSEEAIVSGSAAGRGLIRIQRVAGRRCLSASRRLLTVKLTPAKYCLGCCFGSEHVSLNRRVLLSLLLRRDSRTMGLILKTTEVVDRGRRGEDRAEDEESEAAEVSPRHRASQSSPDSLFPSVPAPVLL